MSEDSKKKLINGGLLRFEIGLAKEGSTKDAVDLLRKVLSRIENDKPLPESLKEYFTKALSHIIDGVDPRLALFLVGKQGQDKTADIHRNYNIARIYRTHKNLNKLQEVVESLRSLGFEVNKSRAEKIHRKFKDVLDLEEESGCIPPYQKRTKK